MKKLLLILIALPMIGFGQNVNIPDANFKAYLVGNSLINTNGDTEIQVSEASSYVRHSSSMLYDIDCDNMNISDLTGIEAFTSITSLYCNDNQLTSLDVSQNTALEELSCNKNQLTSLDVSNNTVLHTLHSRGNQLTSLDVSNHPSLQFLWVGESSLTSLDVSGANLLNNIFCDSSQLTSLDVSNLPALLWVGGDLNQFTSLDVSNSLALTNLTLSGGQLTSLDISANTALRNLECTGNQLTSLDVSQNTALEKLHIAQDSLFPISLDVSNHPSLRELTIGGYVTSLDVSGANNLYMLFCPGSQLTHIDVSDAPALTILYSPNSPQLISVDLRNGNNQIMISTICQTGSPELNFCPNLTCINVDDSIWSTMNWTTFAQGGTLQQAVFDSHHYFSNNCPAQSWDCNNGVCNDPGTGSGQYSTQAACNAVCVVSAIQEHNTNKELLKVTDLLGREKKDSKNEVLFYIYDDGTVEKRIVIE